MAFLDLYKFLNEKVETVYFESKGWESKAVYVSRFRGILENTFQLLFCLFR